MSPLDRGVVLWKLDVLADRLEALRPFAEGDLDRYQSDRV